MKEATGEANMTVVTIVLIAIVLGVGTIIVTNLMHSASDSTSCTSCGGYWSGGTCYVSEGSTQTITNFQTCQ